MGGVTVMQRTEARRQGMSASHGQLDGRTCVVYITTW